MARMARWGGAAAFAQDARAGMAPTVPRMSDVLSYAIVLAVSVAATALILWELGLLVMEEFSARFQRP